MQLKCAVALYEEHFILFVVNVFGQYVLYKGEGTYIYSEKNIKKVITKI